MGAHEPEKPHSGMRHMTVVAATPRGILRMVGMVTPRISLLRMTLSTGAIADRDGFKLVIGILTVHCVARHARHLPRRKAARFDHAIEIASRNSNRAISPESIAEKVRFFSNSLCKPRRR